MVNVVDIGYVEWLEAAILGLLEEGMEPHELSRLVSKKVELIWRGLLEEKSNRK